MDDYYDYFYALYFDVFLAYCDFLFSDAIDYLEDNLNYSDVFGDC